MIGTASAVAGPPERPPPAIVRAPGFEPLAYPAPEPGTYELPVLGTAADGTVLDASGARRRLHDVLGDKIVVLSFAYTSCPDPNACPLAAHVLSRVQQRALEDPAVGSHVRLITLSFDPARDGPAAMRHYGSRVAREGADWRFLTTDSKASLAPILSAYGQSIVKERDEDGRPLGTISHVLRVYLIDRDKRIRNIYTTSFLHADTVWSDIRTVLGEGGEEAGAAGPEVGADGAAAASAPGGGRRGYERDDDATPPSRSLAPSRAAAAKLLAFYRDPPLGLPPVPAPPDNPPTPEKVALGRALFFDRRLSWNNTVSCAMCHIPGQGFTSNEIATAVGIEGRSVRRNAPTIYNVAYASLLFHDGREERLEQQVWAPLLSANEMGNPSVGSVLARLRALPDYAGRFERAFGGRGPTMETVGMALASYERTLVSADSAFDRWRFGGDREALSAAAARGFGIFTGKAGCAGCHSIGEDHALFTDQRFHDTGVGYRQAMGNGGTGAVMQVAPGVVLRLDPSVLTEIGVRRQNDLGRYEATGDPDDRWKYRTSSLRNVALTAPYMHDGSLSTLRDVVVFYDGGGVPHALLDPRIRPLGLDATEMDDLVAFLRALTGANVSVLVADALAAPVGDPR
jgi:cytochrome c peroxidase